MSQSLARRLWIYQAERFPLAKTVPLLAVFSTASINVSAILAGRPLPGPGAYAVAALLAIGIFFQMRVCDEWKDLDDDRRFRPERPIPRGLVSLGLVVRLGVLVGLGMFALAWSHNAGTLLLLLAVWAWLAMMTLEFGAPAWLKARPVLYLASHMLIVPLIDLLLTGIEWTAAGPPHPALVLFLGMSFTNGCVLEIGRKVWASQSERDGVETYSGLWGPRRAAAIWVVAVCASLVLLVLLGAAMGNAVPFVVTGGTGLVMVALCAWCFRSTPTPAWQARVDATSGIWVLVCYLTAGFLPLVTGG